MDSGIKDALVKNDFEKESSTAVTELMGKWTLTGNQNTDAMNGVF